MAFELPVLNATLCCRPAMGASLLLLLGKAGQLFALLLLLLRLLMPPQLAERAEWLRP
jgi:hypothetical protein